VLNAARLEAGLASFATAAPASNPPRINRPATSSTGARYQALPGPAPAQWGEADTESMTLTRTWTLVLLRSRSVV
jgi:hypothetical protein